MAYIPGLSEATLTAVAGAYKDELKAALKIQIQRLKSASKIKEIVKQISKDQKIKTIWHTDRPFSLRGLYYPASLSRSSDKNIITIKNLSQLQERCVIFYGTAGQGKSIFLRYLINEELKASTRLPLFCELRDIKNENIEEFLAEKFCTLLKVDKDTELFAHFCAQGKITFLLDGFDEINEDRTRNFLREIGDFARKYDLCRIAITSRPDYDCQYLEDFYGYDIQPIKSEELEKFYKKVTKDPDFSKKIVSAINSSPTEIKSLITTPLLATLLAISYRTVQKIPLEFSEFYEELFQILLIRHDGAKKGWVRNRKSKITDREIQRIFEAVCFIARQRNTLYFSAPDFLEITDAGIRKTGIEASTENYISDIKNITCLVVKEAKGYSFIHSSVTEFFAAKYIKNLSEVASQKIYDIFLKGRWNKWRQEIMFLEQIDLYRFQKYFLMPDLINVLDIFSDENSISVEKIEKYLKSIFINKRVDEKSKGYRFSISGTDKYNSYIFSSINNRAINYSISHGAGKSWTNSFEDNKSSSMSLYDIAAHRGNDILNSVISLLEKTIQAQALRMSNVGKDIARKENFDEFEGI